MPVSLEDIQANIEALGEAMSLMKLAQDRDNLVLYGSEDIHLEGLISKVEKNQLNIKAINGIPNQVKCLDEKVDALIEASKKRQWIIIGVGIGISIQIASAAGLWDLVKGLL